VIFSLLGKVCLALHMYRFAEAVFCLSAKCACYGNLPFSVGVTWSSIALTYLERGDSNKGLDILKSRLADDPKDAMRHVSLAFYYLDLDQPGLAQVHFKRAMAMEDDLKIKHTLQGCLNDLESLLNNPACPT